MKYLIIFISIILSSGSVFAQTYEGIVSELNSKNSGQIIDKSSGKGIGNAKISIPGYKYLTKTDKDGYFELNTDITDTVIMSVKKDKYKPFSMTINNSTFTKPIVIGIEKSDKFGIEIDSDIHHLGDNSYSEISANAGEFIGDAIGPFFKKRFFLKNINASKPVYMVIGSIIGIDTQIARSMGQNKNPNSYASPPEVYFNGNKISEIKINGDGQKIKLPANLIKKNHINEIVIKTGRNLMQTSYVDYDDIEFMNLIIEN